MAKKGYVLPTLHFRLVFPADRTFGFSLRPNMLPPDTVSVLRAGRQGGCPLLLYVEGISVMAKGTVKWFDATKGFGFIEPEDGSKDAFVHISAVERAGLSGLRDGQKVEFDLTAGKNGKMAADNIVALD
jgi:CspA family cold shock protein